MIPETSVYCPALPKTDPRCWISIEVENKLETPSAPPRRGLGGHIFCGPDGHLPDKGPFVLCLSSPVLENPHEAQTNFLPIIRDHSHPCKSKSKKKVFSYIAFLFFAFPTCTKSKVLFKFQEPYNDFFFPSPTWKSNFLSERLMAKTNYALW